jgi:DNA-binding transcriptional MerR regulator
MGCERLAEVPAGEFGCNFLQVHADLVTARFYRQYSAGVMNRLSLVRNAQRFGFSLRDIAGFLRARDAGGKPCHDVRAAAQRMLAAVDRQIAELVSTRKQMHNTLKTWDLKLEGTPSDQPAHLLEGLSGTRRPKPVGRDKLQRRGSGQ